MAGMLAGVETARRRRIHQSSGGSGWSPPSSSSSSSSSPVIGLGLGLGRSSSTNSSSSFWQRSRGNQGDEKLGRLAREAKKRLDERLRAQGKLQITRNNSDVSEASMNGRTEATVRELRTEVFGSRKNGGAGGGCGGAAGGSRRLMGWARRGLKQWEQEEEECAVCLEEFKVGENLVNLPCAHRFHSRCMLPWLQTSSHCPCCRMSILSDSSF